MADLQGIAQALPQVLAQTAGIRADLAREAKQRARIIRVGIGVGVIVAAMTGLLLAMMFAAQSSRARIIDCTTAGTPAHPHPCYDDGQARTSAAVTEINRAGAHQTMEIQACRYQPDVAAFRACVADIPNLGLTSP